MKIYSLKRFYYSLVFNIFLILQGILLFSFSITAKDTIFLQNTLQYIYGVFFIINLLLLSIIYVIFSYKIKNNKLLLMEKDFSSLKKFNYKVIIISGIFSFPFTSYILKFYNTIPNIQIYNASQVLGCIFGLILMFLSLTNIFLNFETLKTKLHFYKKL